MDVTPQLHSLRVQLTIRNAGTLVHGDTIPLLLNGGLTLVDVRGPLVAGYRQSTSDDIKRIAIRRATAPVGDEIDIIYSGQPKFGGDSINNIGPDWVELSLDSFWQPIVEGFGQTIVSRTRVNVSPEWQVVSSGDVRDEGSYKVVTNTVPLPDVPFVAAPKLRVTESRGNRVYDAGSPAAVVQRVLETASDCASYLNSIFPSHLPPLRIVLAPRKGPGYSRQNYIVITPGQDIERVPLERFLCHEEAHFWAIGAVASGPENWLNEGMAEFLSGRAVRRLSGQLEYEAMLTQWRKQSVGQPAVWTDTSSRRPGPMVSYRKAPALLAVLEERIGVDKMNAVLSRFLTQPVHTTPVLLDVIGDVAGAETSQWFRALLGGTGPV